MQNSIAMNNPVKRPYWRVVSLLFVGAVALLLVILVSQREGSVQTGQPPIAFQMSVFRGNRQLSTEELSHNDAGLFSPILSNYVKTTDRYLYLRIKISNSHDKALNVVLANRRINYFTALLKTAPNGVNVLYRHGDTVPASSYAIRDVMAAFPLHLPAHSVSTYFVEYHAPRGIAAEPRFYTPSAYVDVSSDSRAAAGAITGFFLSLALFNLFSGLISDKKDLTAVGAFVLSELFFYLRQSRQLLLMISPATYPDWLFPISIAMSLFFGFGMGHHLLGHYMHTWDRIGLRVLMVAGAIVAILSLFTLPFVAADALNYDAVLVIGLLALSAIRGIRAGDRKVLLITLSFLPWLLVVLPDIGSDWLSVRNIALPDAFPYYGVLAQLVFLTIALQITYTHERRQAVAAAEEAVERLRSQQGNELASLSGLRRAVLHRTGALLSAPLDTLISTAQLMLDRATEPDVAASAALIIEDGLRLRKQLGDEVFPKPSDSDTRILTGTEKTPSSERSRRSERIWLFGDNEAVFDVSRMLESRGFSPHTESDYYAVLRAAASDLIDVLIVDPGSQGLRALDLCQLVRAEHNMLQLPVLIIVDAYSDYVINRGYAVGANDFLVRPFDAHILYTRTQSLLRLKQVAGHNMRLERSEDEKNTFLFFLTHNVNTPLTILLNRIRDLQQLMTLDDLKEIVEDLSSCTYDINDIVQNVLVSFRIADGRQTIRLERIDVIDIIQNLSGEMMKKSGTKQQKLTLPETNELFAVCGDRTSVRSILYNLIDNAIKFTPIGGSIDVTIEKGGDVVTVCVADNGPGILQDEVDAVFQRFQRLSTRPTNGEPSTGLGLYVARELARMNGGEISYHHNGGSGARFVLELPRAAEGATDSR